MSAKQLKKMQLQQQLDREDRGEEEEAHEADEEEEEEEEAKPRGKASAFALLNSNSEEEEEEEEDEEEKEEKEREEAERRVPPLAATKAPQTQTQGGNSKAKKKKQKQKKKNGRGAANQADEEDEDALLDQFSTGQDALEAAAASASAIGGGRSCVLAMSKADFSAEREERRLLDTAGAGGAASAAAGGVGGSGGQQRKMAAAPRGQGNLFAHHRRLFIATPDQNELWPRPEHTANMVLAGSRDDGTPCFDIRSSKHHERVRRELAEAQLTHDPEELQFFLSQEPFCVEALLLVGELLRAQGDHEAYFRLMRRMVYSIECGFEAGFSPFTPSRLGPNPEWPRVALHLPELGTEEELAWPGWPWLAGLSQYMLALTSRGLHVTASQVCRLLLAMTLPRDPMHLLICLDALCLRSSRLDFLSRLVRDLVADLPTTEKGLCRTLDCLLPNFAFSHALGLRRKAGTSADSDLAATLNLISVSDVIPPELQAGPQVASELEENALPHAALMRALLLFPQVLVPLLEGAAVQMDARPPVGSPYQQVTWRELIAGQPFTGANSYRHQQHFLAYALMSGAYGAICGPLWRGDATLAWLHGAAVRLQQMFGSSLFAQELNDARERWRVASTALDPALLDYQTFNLAEVGPERLLPRVVQQSLERLLHEERMASYAAGAAAAAAGEQQLPEANVDEEELLRRALEASRREQEALERRRLVHEQDAEYHASLQADRDRENGVHPSPDMVAETRNGGSGTVPLFDEEVSQLVTMGFDAVAARAALQACGGDIATATDRLLA